MLAKDVHLEKYRQFWTSRGYDILTVQTTPLGLLFPVIGTGRYGREVIRFLAQNHYRDIVFHNFSVGTYVSSVFRYQLKRAVDRGDPGTVEIRDAFRGMVLDSVTFLEDSPGGTAAGVTNSPLGQLLIKYSIILYYIAAFPFTLTHYYSVSRILQNQKLPALVFYSKSDPLINPKRIENLVSHWERNGVEVRAKCWDKSDHVQHYRQHHDEYVEEVERFLAKLGLPKRKLD